MLIEHYHMSGKKSEEILVGPIHMHHPVQKEDKGGYTQQMGEDI